MSLFNNLKRFFRSFKFAASGIVFAIKNEQNMRFHAVSTIYVCFFSSLCKISRIEACILALTIAAVIACELINTAIESNCDYATREKSDKIKASKDCASGSVLVTAICSVIVAFLIFIQEERLDTIFGFFIDKPFNIIIFIITIIISFTFVFTTNDKRKRENNEY